MNDLMLSGIISALISAAASFATSKGTIALEKKKENRKLKERSDKLKSDVLASVSAWLNQSHSMSQKKIAVDCISAAYVNSSGTQFDMLFALYNEMTKQCPNKQIVLPLLNQYAQSVSQEQSPEP